MNSSTAKWAYLLLLSLIWGSSFILIKKGLEGLTAMQLGALRTIVTGSVLLLAGGWTFKSIPKSKWKWLVASGLLGSFLPAFCFAFAETEIDSAVVSVLNSLVPINTIILGVLIFNINSTKKQVVGILIGLVGTIILILAGARLNPDQNYIFAGFVIAATLMYAANANIIKRYLSNVSPLAIAAGQYVFIIIPAIVILLTSNFFDDKTIDHPKFYPSIGYIVLLSVFGTAIAKVAFNKLVHLSSPVFASSVTYIMPIVALFWGILDGESFGIIQSLASILILLGVYLAHRKKSFKSKKPSQK